MVPKKLDASAEEKWLIVVDYRKLNNITVNDKYHIPNMAQGFHQIEMDSKDR